jgi:hypothetical protein
VSDLAFDVLGVTGEQYSVAPTMTFHLRVIETTGVEVHCLALRTMIRIEPVKRKYTDAEGERIGDLFGDRSRWGDTMKPVQFASASSLVPGFTGATQVDIPIPLTYDFDVSTAKYLHGLDDGEVPFILLFSGTVFVKGESNFTVEQVPWHKETLYRMPVSVWRSAMDAHYPGGGWIRVNKDRIDALQRFKSRHTLTTWDETIDTLLAKAGETSPLSNGTHS